MNLPARIERRRQHPVVCRGPCRVARRRCVQAQAHSCPRCSSRRSRAQGTARFLLATREGRVVFVGAQRKQNRVGARASLAWDGLQLEASACIITRHQMRGWSTPTPISACDAWRTLQDVAVAWLWRGVACTCVPCCCISIRNQAGATRLAGAVGRVRGVQGNRTGHAAWCSCTGTCTGTCTATHGGIVPTWGARRVGTGDVC